MRGIKKVIKVILIIFCVILILDALFVVSISLYRPKVQKTDAIIVLGAAINTPALYNRSLEGLRLYQEGKGDVLVLSGGVDYPKSISEAEYMKKIIKLNQTSEVPLILEDESSDTYENITKSKQKIPQAKSITIVSDKFHLARAVLIAKRAGFEPVYWSSPKPYYYNVKELSFYYFREFAAMIEYIPRFIRG